MQKVKVLFQWISLLPIMAGLVLSNETAARSPYPYISGEGHAAVSTPDGETRGIFNGARMTRRFYLENSTVSFKITQAQAAAVKQAFTGSGERMGRDTVLQKVASVSPNDLTRRNNEGSATVEVTLLDLSTGPGSLEFRVVLDSHSIALDYDLRDLTILVDDRGNEYRAASWDGTVGGHHVEGLLKFVGRDRILNTGASFLEVRMTGVAGVPSRTFRWDLQR